VEPVRGIRQACRQDARKECPGKLGQDLTACLRERRSTPGRLSPACDAKVFEVQEVISHDVSLAPGLFDACRGDIENIPSCKENKERVPVVCLKQHRVELSDQCRGKLFGWEVEAAQNLQLNKAVQDACENEIHSVCGDGLFGEARMLKCLWETMTPGTLRHEWAADNTWEFSPECREKVTETTQRGVSDYRLDFKVRTTCRGDIDEICPFEKAAVDNLTMAELFGTKEADSEAKSGMVLRCLKVHLREIKSPFCKEEMGRVVRIQAVDAKADPILTRVCKADIEQYCSSSPPDEVHLCLRAKMAHLSSECKAAEALQGNLEAGDVTMKPQLAYACKSAISQFCGDVTAGDAQVIRCLQDHMDDQGFPSDCHKMVFQDMQASNNDWRLKYGISQECKKDATELCGDVLEEGAGKVLKCLKMGMAPNAQKKVKAAGCKHEMLRFISQGVNDIRLAPNTYHACVSDVEKLCGDVEPGGGRVHDCLLNHKPSLSSECAREEFHTQMFRAGNIDADKSAVKDCSTSISRFCQDTIPGQGAMWKCLAEHLSDAEMPAPCKLKVRKVQALQHTEFFLDPAMSKHCNVDAARICESDLRVAEYKDFSSLGDVTTCLISKVAQVSNSACRTDIRRKARERLTRVELDPVRMNMCEHDIDEHCSAEKGGVEEGKVHKCLVEHFRELRTTCQDVQKTYMVVASSDARVNVPVRMYCQGATKKFCESVEMGEGRVMNCLLEHMHDQGMNTECKTVLLDEAKKRAMDYEFNVKLKRACDPVWPLMAWREEKFGSLVRQVEVEVNCDRSRENWQTVCLTNNIPSITGPGAAACKSEVRNVLKLQSSDLRARPGMASNCKEDIERLCSDTEAGAGRWHQCLRKRLDNITNPLCKQQVTKFTSVAGSHATIDYTIRTRCASEMNRFCKDTPAGEMRTMICLKVNANKETEGFSQGCKNALAKVTGQDMIKKMTNFTKRKHNSLDELKDFIFEHQSFSDKWGAGLLVGTICFVAVLSFCGSYCILRRKFNQVMYTMAQPNMA
jgi:Golgi apparatus protein 1